MTTPDQPRWSSRPARAHKIRARSTPAGVATTTEKVPPSGPVPSTRSTNPSRSAWAIPLRRDVRVPVKLLCHQIRVRHRAKRRRVLDHAIDPIRELQGVAPAASCSRPMARSVRQPDCRRGVQQARHALASVPVVAPPRGQDPATARLPESIFMLPTPFPGSGVTRERDPNIWATSLQHPLGSRLPAFDPLEFPAKVRMKPRF